MDWLGAREPHQVCRSAARRVRDRGPADRHAEGGAVLLGIRGARGKAPGFAKFDVEKRRRF
jgi:hypothetical protein